MDYKLGDELIADGGDISAEDLRNIAGLEKGRVYHVKEEVSEDCITLREKVEGHGSVFSKGRFKLLGERR